jgi:hypothetical protein
MFDPMVSPWHALMMLAMPVGFGLLLISSNHEKMSIVGQVCVACALPLMSLIVLAIGIKHLSAIMYLFIGCMRLVTEPLEFRKALFGDYYASPIAGLAYLGPLAGCGMAVSLMTKKNVHGINRIVLPVFITSALFVSYQETQSSSLEGEISKAYENLEAGHGVKASSVLETGNARNVLARLSRPGQQFSSAGALYAVGPVDVFGPWTYIQRGSLHPVEVLNQTKWPKYSKLYDALWPGQTPQPYSWRGLSPWETSKQ